MTFADSATPFIQSPLAVTLVGAICVALLTLAGAAIRIVVQLARMEANVAAIREDVANIQRDPDIMRWSNYGRAVQALPVAVPSHLE